MSFELPALVWRQLRDLVQGVHGTKLDEGTYKFVWLSEVVKHISGLIQCNLTHQQVDCSAFIYLGPVNALNQVPELPSDKGW